ncbi:hypothetical protein T02_3008 [Trichinella nativa]|uniref:Uncharacterized protein n=1 Tax=Trichinella nativa TaxID=6335 RepID=A0A0V1IGK6_9BILA|nr:hypothetical protein T02_3008 [Trichinella nativa]
MARSARSSSRSRSRSRSSSRRKFKPQSVLLVRYWFHHQD